MAKVSIRIWILIIALIIAIISIINFNGFSGGVQVNNIEKNSSSYVAGISRGEVIKQVNGQPVNSIIEFYTETSKINVSPVEISIKTENQTINYKSNCTNYYCRY